MATEKRKPKTYWRKKNPDMLYQEYKGAFTKTEKENAINFFEGDEFCIISTSDVKWMNRLEGGLGFEPANIIYCSESTGEFREYENVPVRMLKLPSPPKRMKRARANRMNWKEIQQDGTIGWSIMDKDCEWPRSLRETAYNWCASDREVRIVTANTKIQNRVESLGVKPTQVLHFEKYKKVDERWYDIPKTWMKLPSNWGNGGKKNDESSS